VLIVLCLVCDVALNRPSYQISANSGGAYGPHLANDGSREDVLGPPSDPHCVHSKSETNPWWVVDLGVPLTVREVFFTNRRSGDGKYTFHKFYLKLMVLNEHASANDASKLHVSSQIV